MHFWFLCVSLCSYKAFGSKVTSICCQSSRVLGRGKKRGKTMSTKLKGDVDSGLMFLVVCVCVCASVLCVSV